MGGIGVVRIMGIDANTNIACLPDTSLKKTRENLRWNKRSILRKK